MYIYADYAIGHANKRNNIQSIKDFKLNGVITDCYRSIFLFDEGLREYVNRTKSITGYSGKHISDGLVFDFDGTDLNGVKKEVYNFCNHLYYEYDVPYEYLRIAFSGSKGIHITIPMQAICNPEPKEDFYKIYKEIAEDLSIGFKFVDHSIYERARLFRITNTINSKSGLYKIPLNFDELDGLTADEIKELARSERKIELLPISEMEIVTPLNDIYEKWNTYQPGTEQPKKRDEIIELLQGGLSEGNRHEALIRITGSLQNKGLDYDFILEWLRHWNKSNNPPLTDERLEVESRRVYNDNLKRNIVDKKEILSLKDAAGIYETYVHNITKCKIKTGFKKIDDRIRGIMPGETLCVLGKTSVGKSAFLHNIGLNYAKESNEPVLFFSMEMPTTSVYERTLQIETGYSGYNIENFTRESDIELKAKAELIFSELSNFYIITKNGLNLNQIKEFILFGESNIYHRKTGLVLIDYLGLVRGEGKDLYEQTSRVARGMKDLSKEINVPIIFLSQVTKQFTEYDELQINSARDSGSVDEASDFVLAIWKEKDKRPENEQSDIPINLAILKNRKGGLGKIRVRMQKRNLKILEDVNE